jgi:hypothetical protein
LGCDDGVTVLDRDVGAGAEGIYETRLPMRWFDSVTIMTQSLGFPVRYTNRQSDNQCSARSEALAYEASVARVCRIDDV